MPLSWTSHLNCTSTLGYQEISVCSDNSDLGPCSFLSYTREVEIFCIFVRNLGLQEDLTEDEPLPQGSLGIQDKLSCCDTTLTTLEVEFQKKIYLP